MPPNWPRDYRITLGIVVATLLSIGWVEARTRAIARPVVLEEIAKDREQFKKDAIEAARDGADRAISRAMQDEILPMHAEIRVHDAKQEEHRQEDDRRFKRLERRVGISNE